jgi:hypothetical protein
MKSKHYQHNREQARRHSEQARVLSRPLYESEPIIVGTLSQVSRTCGNPNCHCATQGSKHPVWTLLTKHEGKRRCQVVRKADVQWVAHRVRRYQQLREALRQIRKLDAAKHRLLKELIQARHDPYK